MLRMVRPDAKGRINLGRLAKGVSGYRVKETADHTIILEPYAEVPAREKWLFDSDKALKQVRQGLQDAAAAGLSERGSFASFVEDEEV